MNSKGSRIHSDYSHKKLDIWPHLFELFENVIGIRVLRHSVVLCECRMSDVSIEYFLASLHVALTAFYLQTLRLALYYTLRLFRLSVGLSVTSHVRCVKVAERIELGLQSNVILCLTIKQYMVCKTQLAA